MTDLGDRLADGSSGSDHFGANRLAVHFPGTKGIDRSFIKTDETAQRAADLVQLVLDDQIRGS